MLAVLDLPGRDTAAVVLVVLSRFQYAFVSLPFTALGTYLIAVLQPWLVATVIYALEETYLGHLFSFGGS